MSRRHLPRVQCPVCGRPAPVTRSSERIQYHHNHLTGRRCEGIGTPVDLYGGAR